MLKSDQVWNADPPIEFGYLHSINQSVIRLQSKFPYFLNTVDQSNLIIASDYSGQHKESEYEAFSFFITTSNNLCSWMPSLIEFREKFLPDGRNLSFKKIREPVRWSAFPHFLDIAGKLNANLITVLIHKQVGTFVDGGPSAIKEILPECFPNAAKLGTVEKMIRLANFISLFLSALRKKEQRAFWISDEDEAFDTFEKREGFCKLATYMHYGITGEIDESGIFLGTTEMKNAPAWSEDLAAIADIAAGSYCKLSNVLPTNYGIKNWTVRIKPQKDIDERALVFGDWISKDDLILKSLLIRVELDCDRQIRTSAQVFTRNR
ncbi:hypothetical protein [Minwuia sp.]|uniref:hypothetical protein n=1 Tax=Minwuia sp. TaxID=2493630 RepID=UPI003A8EDD86